MLDILDITHPGANDNPGGTATTHGYALFSSIGTLQAPKEIIDADVTFATLGSIVTAHVFKTGKCMGKIYATEGKGQVTVKSAGDIDGRGARSEFKFNTPGSRAEVDGWARWFRNNICIFFAKEADGTVRQIGSADFPAHVMVNYDTGANNDGYRGYEVTVSAFGEAPIYIPGLNFTPAT